MGADNNILTRSGQLSTINLGRYGNIADLDTTNFCILDDEGRKIPFHIINEAEDNITLSVKYPYGDTFQDRVFFAENESPLMIEEIEADGTIGVYTLAWGY